MKRLLITLLFSLHLVGVGYSQELTQEAFDHRIDSLFTVYNSYEMVADTLELMGRPYYLNQEFDNALAYFVQVLKIRERINSPKIITSYLYFGNIAGLRGEGAQAIGYFRQALDYAIERDSLRLGAVYNNMGKFYRDFSNGDPLYLDSAIYFNLKALEFKRTHGADMGSIFITMNNLGSAYEVKGMTDSAIVYFKNVIDQAAGNDAANVKNEYAWSLINMGYVRHKSGDYDSALYYYNRALPIVEGDSLRGPMSNLYYNLFYTNLALKQDTAAYYFEQHIKYLKDLFNESNNQIVQDLRIKYDLAKKETQLAQNTLELERQRAANRLYLIAGGIVILLLIALLAFFMYRQKIMQQLRKKDEAIHVQQVNEIMRNQELSVLSARVEGQDMERQRIAEDLHDRLGSKLSAVKLYYDAVQGDIPNETMDKARSLLDETIDETRRIAHNLSSGVLTRFGLIAAVENLKETLENTKKVEIEFIDYNFDNHKMGKELEENFYRIIQELISNILKHAQATLITIQLTRHNDGVITLMVEDNGIGFNPGRVAMESMGLLNLKSRVERFDGSFSIDSEPGHGTTVIVEIDEKQKLIA